MRWPILHRASRRACGGREWAAESADDDIGDVTKPDRLAPTAPALALAVNIPGNCHGEAGRSRSPSLDNALAPN